MRGRRGRCSRAAGTALSLGALVLGGCRELPRPPDNVPFDSGPTPDAAVTAALADRYAAVADRQGTGRCRCAIDVPFCRAQLEADWDAAGLRCIAGAAALDANGFDEMLVCLDAAMTTFEGCHAGLACSDVQGRADCTNSWEATGSGCFDLLAPAAVDGLLTCDPSNPDAGVDAQP